MKRRKDEIKGLPKPNVNFTVHIPQEIATRIEEMAEKLNKTPKGLGGIILAEAFKKTSVSTK